MKKCFVLFTLFIYFHDFVASQNQQIDSLRKMLLPGSGDTNKVNVLNALGTQFRFISNFDSSLFYSDKALSLSRQIQFEKGESYALYNTGVIHNNRGEYLMALQYDSASLAIRQKLKDKKGIADCFILNGLILYNMGNYTSAIKEYLKALKLYEELASTERVAIACNDIGLVYWRQRNYPEALKSYNRGLQAYESIKNKSGMSACMNNIALIYLEQNNYPEALKKNLISLQLDEELGDKQGEAISLSNIGIVYQSQNKYDSAMSYYLRATKIREELNDLQGMANSYGHLGSLSTDMKKFPQAAFYLQKALALAKTIGEKAEIREAYKNLSVLDSVSGNWNAAYNNYKLYVNYRDSLINEENTRAITQQAMQYDFDKKEAAAQAAQEKKDAIAEAEIKKQWVIRNAISGSLAIVLLFTLVVYRQRNRISKEKKRSDELLLNILPGEVAEELKHKGSANAKHFDNVTVMFTDFKDFTQISEKLSPSELVAEIDMCFKAFDHIVGRHNIEKIKTIGDAYMCAGGLPVNNSTHATDVVTAALEIQQFMKEHLEQRKKAGKEPFEIRIGIHSGPVVAGIVGVKKFAYDIWGDTVNIASRMESSGEAGKVNISGSTYELVKDKFTCIHRGKIQAKNKGEIDMYFVEA